MNYEEIKTWYKGHDDKIVIGVCFILIFLVGFGTGRYVKDNAKTQTQSYSTTNSAKKPFFQATNQAVTPVKAAVNGTSTTASGPCAVKGNISSTGKKIYHVLGGAFYNTVKPEQCFNTEDEALAAGFVKSSR